MNCAPNTLDFVFLFAAVAFGFGFVFVDLKNDRLRRKLRGVEAELLQYRVFRSTGYLNLDAYLLDLAHRSVFKNLPWRQVFVEFLRGMGSQGVPGHVQTPVDMANYVRMCVGITPNMSSVYQWFYKAYTAEKLPKKERLVLRKMLIVLWPHLLICYRGHSDFSLLRNTYMNGFDLDDEDIC
jgi:hypothetical protein